MIINSVIILIIFLVISIGIWFILDIINKYVNSINETESPKKK